MKKIEPKFIEKGEGDDIFAYYREFYSVDDPTESNIITIKASSTLDEDEYNWSDVSVIISKREGLRWVSQETIDFHSNYIDLLYYTFETHPGLRFNKEWKISLIEAQQFLSGNSALTMDLEEEFATEMNKEKVRVFIWIRRNDNWEWVAAAPKRGLEPFDVKIGEYINTAE